MQQISRRLFRSIDLRPCCSQLICGNGGEPTPLAALGARLLSTHSLEFDLLPGTVLSVTCTQRDTNVAAVNGLPDKVELTAADCTVQHSDGPLIGACGAKGPDQSPNQHQSAPCTWDLHSSPNTCTCGPHISPLTQLPMLAVQLSQSTPATAQ